MDELDLEIELRTELLGAISNPLFLDSLASQIQDLSLIMIPKIKRKCKHVRWTDQECDKPLTQLFTYNGFRDKTVPLRPLNRKPNPPKKKHTIFLYIVLLIVLGFLLLIE